MKNYKVILISFVLIFFLIGSVSAADNASDEAVGAQMLPIVDPIGPIVIDPINPGGDDGGDDEPIDVEVTTKDVYVNSTGDDSNVGSKESPYATVSKAVSEVNASNDATIHIAEGTYMLEGSTVHYVEDYGDGEVEEWDEDLMGLNIDLNHQLYGGNLKFIGAGADKTILDGQSLYYFASIGMNSNVTIKDIAFINCKNYNGGTIANYGNLNIENCIFKESSSNDCGGAIYCEGPERMINNGMWVVFMPVDANLTVINSEFISCSATSGGAISTRYSNLFLKNNTFINTKADYQGAAVNTGYLTQYSVFNLIDNKFINLTGSQDASIYMQANFDNENSIIGNQFINCSNPSEQYSIVSLDQGKFKFENNTFINSSNIVGNIYNRYATMSNLQIKMDYNVINVSNYEVSKGFKLNNITTTDDMGNIVSMGSLTVNLNNDDATISRTISMSNGEGTFTFSEVPEEGIYELTLSSGETVSDVVGIVNITLNNDPVELWVSPEGLDANDGTEESPFATIQHAIDTGFEKSFTVIVHLGKGTYAKDGNVELTIANKGSLQIIGEKYNETIIDGEGTSWFLKVSTTNVNITNLKFINGYSNRHLIDGGNKLYLENCIFDSNPLSNSNYHVLTNAKFDKIVYTNNKGKVNVNSRFNITNSYFANNNYYSSGNGVLMIGVSGVVVKDSKFINNTGGQNGAAIGGSFTSINNYYENNSPMISGGAVYISGDSTFINDTFVNNHARDYGGAFFVSISSSNPSKSPKVSFDNCKFINNSASKGGVGYLSIGKFVDCSFINNTADYGGAFYLVPYVKVDETNNDDEDDEPIEIIPIEFDPILGAQMLPDIPIIPIVPDIPLDPVIPIVPVIPVIPGEDEEVKEDINSLELTDCTFENNVARLNGNDIYLEEPTNWRVNEGIELAYGIPLTITFNSKNVTSLVDDLTATVYGPCNTVIGAKYLTFELNGTKIGSPEVVNSLVTFNYAGFEEGDYILNGPMEYPNNKNIVNPGLISVKLENILNHVELWVSVNGSDETGNGSEDNPFKSLSKAINEGTKNCRDITINVCEGTYTGDLNTGLTISCMNNITLNGAGIDKTIIDGNDLSTFARITEGNNKVVFTNLTIQNMVPIKTANVIRPIEVDENATLCLDNVKITKFKSATGGYGNVLVDNSIFTQNIGVVGSMGTVVINNSYISESVSGISGGDLTVNNTIIKDLLTSSGFNLIAGEKCTIENTAISNDCNNESLSEFGLNVTYAHVNPAVAVISYNVKMNNVTIDNNFASPVYETQTGYGDGSALSAFGYLYGSGGKNVSVTNSSFSNFRYLWCVNTWGLVNFDFDGCVFNNITMISQSQSTNVEGTESENSSYVIHNSVFVNSGLAIDRLGRTDRPNPNCDFNDNYWGSNDKPVIQYINLNSPRMDKEYVPTSWIILTSEDGKTINKTLTDGENSTNYTGIAPIREGYADDKGSLGYAVVFGPVGYLFTTDDDKNVIFNESEAIYPFVDVDPMSYRDNAIMDISKINGSGAVFGSIFDVVGNPVANATIVYTLNGVEANTTTDADGRFVVFGGNGDLNITFIGNDNFFPIEKVLTLENIAPVKTETALDTVISGDLNITSVLRDINGNPIAGAVITYVVNGTEMNVTTDDKGEFVIPADNNVTVAISYPGGDAYLPTSVSVGLDSISTTRIATVIEADYTFTRVANDYGAGERGDFFYATLKDINGNPLANVTCYVAVNGPIYNVTTDENGKFGVQVNLAAANTYTYALSFLGNDKYEASLNCSKLILTAKKTSITASAKTFKAKAKTKSVSVTLKTSANPYDKKTYLKAGKKVTLKVNGKTYTAKTNAKGVAKFNLKLTKKGKYTAKISFAGDKTYKSCSKSIKITIK